MVFTRKDGDFHGLLLLVSGRVTFKKKQFDLRKSSFKPKNSKSPRLPGLFLAFFFLVPGPTNPGEGRDTGCQWPAPMASFNVKAFPFGGWEDDLEDDICIYIYYIYIFYNIYIYMYCNFDLDRIPFWRALRNRISWTIRDDTWQRRPP